MRYVSAPSASGSSRIRKAWRRGSPMAARRAVILRNGVYARPPLTRWSVGRVTLLGDAAHPMTPDMGQGACQAIEDAVILADCPSDAADVCSALRAYDTRRIPRARRVVRES